MEVHNSSNAKRLRVWARMDLSLYLLVSFPVFFTRHPRQSGNTYNTGHIQEEQHEGYESQADPGTRIAVFSHRVSLADR